MMDAPVIFDVPLVGDDGIRKIALDAAGTAHVYTVHRNKLDPSHLKGPSFTASSARDLAAGVLSGAKGEPSESECRVLAAAVLLLDRQIEEMAHAERQRAAARAEEMAL